MAWAAKNTDGTISSVGFDRSTAPVDQSIAIVDIAYHTAVDVMEGRVRLQDCLGTAAVVPPKQQAQTFNTRYPSIMTDRDVNAMIALAAMIPADAVCVEIGSRLCGTAKLLLDNASKIKRLYCIDPEWAPQNCDAFSDPYMINYMMDYWQLDQYENCCDFATQLMAPYPNSRLLKQASPYDLTWWSETVDFIFEDAVHINPNLRDNLDFWVPFVRPGGIIAGHDYYNRFPDVVPEVNALRDRLGAELQVQGTVWWMIKP